MRYTQEHYDQTCLPGRYDMHTGDPKQDLAYKHYYDNRPSRRSSPFIQCFYKTISDLFDQKVYELQASHVSSNVIDQKMYEIQDICDSSWTKLNKRLFKNTPWQDAWVTRHTVFLILYKELYYRQIYANFQSFSQYHCTTNKKSEEEIDFLCSNFKIWNVHSVLHSLGYTSGGDSEGVAGEYGQHSLYKKLGYFSLVGLLPLHSLLGFYYQIIKVMENIKCQVTTYFNINFEFLITCHYQDAIRTFANILFYIWIIHEHFSDDHIKMYVLLTIILTMYSMQINENPQVYEELFRHSSPKFLSPVVCNNGSVGISTLDGKFQSASGVRFYIDKDVIYITDTKGARPYGICLSSSNRYIKFEKLSQMLKKMGQRP
ncbi:unnamed protein product [Nyctereutes procyonoides]|uniref:(raccoon dog) hypothetical protein n=1 Tax=Nyctereutes procyonoides TaxID=34880 RepID=A0A811ZPT8_NYCPR|nr:unnamed protein product [Nyctereutes procyonoides]